MKNQILPDLEKLKEQIENLKKEKVKKLSLVTSMKERNKLMMEIQELEVVLKVPSKMKAFGKTFFKGLGITRKTLWKGIQGASRNLNRNAPEFRELSRGMVKRSTPVSPMMEMYSPASQRRVPIRKMKSVKSKPLKRKMKTPKLKKRKQVKRMKRTSYSKKSKEPMNQMTWEMP